MEYRRARNIDLFKDIIHPLVPVSVSLALVDRTFDDSLLILKKVYQRSFHRTPLLETRHGPSFIGGSNCNIP
jgi:hypothetical protein